MTTMATFRASQIGLARKNISTKASNAISTLNSAIDEALNFTALMHKDPENEFSPEGIAKIRSKFDASLSELTTVNQKIADMLAVRSGDLAIDDFITKYNIDLAKYSSDLD